MIWSSDWSAGLGPRDAAALDWAPGELAIATPEPAGDAPDEAGFEVELEAAFRSGYEAGCEAAAVAERERLQAALGALQTAARAAAARSTPEELLREHVAALAVAVAHHLIGRELRGDQQAIADLVRRAVTQFPLDEAVRIRVNPQDLTLISTLSAGGGPVRVAPGRDVEWIPDAELAAGECIVEGHRRIVDGRLDRALERVYRSLTDG